MESFAKIIIICENNYSRENNERFILDVRQGSEYASNFKYASVLNIAGFWIYQGSEYASGSGYTTIMKYIRVTQGSEYAWICLNNSWMWLIMPECA